MKGQAANDVVGYCPMGCGQTLFLAAGNVTCSSTKCARPGAAGELLADTEFEHLIHFTARSFTIRHPLRERLDDGLFEFACTITEHFRGLAGPPVPLGYYRAIWVPGRKGHTRPDWRLEPVPVPHMEALK